jgi:hypothetical protein
MSIGARRSDRALRWLFHERGQRLPRDLREPIEGTVSGNRRGHQLLGDEAAHLVATAVPRLGANLVQHVFQTRLEARTNFAHCIQV